MLFGDVCPTQNVKEIFREKNTDALFTDVAGITIAPIINKFYNTKKCAFLS